MQLSHPCLFLVDGAALAYRSHFAFIRSPLVTAQGLNVSALFGFTHALLRLIREEKPEYLAVVQDPSGPTFRHEMYPEYKATREKMPEDLASQFALLDDLTSALGVRTVVTPGYEADDLIGTLARRASKEGIHTYIVSGDKDMAQLVSDRVSIYNIAKPDQPVELLDRAGVLDKFKVPPERVVDLLALQGDSSDNIPGLEGVGPTTALKLIEEYPTLEALVENQAKLKLKKVREALAGGPEILFLSRRLATIDTNAPCAVAELDELRLREPDRPKLREMFQRFEFKSLLKEFTDVQATDEHSYTIVKTLEELEAAMPSLKATRLLVVDTETTSLDALDARLVGVSLSPRPREAYYVALQSQGESELDRELIARLKSLLEDGEIPKAGQNVKYDQMVLENHGIRLANVVFDTMIGSFLLDPGGRQHSLDALALKHLSFKKIATEELIGKKGKNQLSMLQVDVETVGAYSCEDADITHRLAELFRPRVTELGLMPLLREVELPLIPVLAAMERVGVRLDLAFLEKLSKELRQQSEKLEGEVFELCGERFNLSSPKQLGQILFDKLEINKELDRRKPKKTKTGGYTTDAKTLESFSGHPVIQKILEHRQLEKLIGTYVDALPALVRKDTGRVHTSFNQTIAITGRLSSTDPNLQNIPIRTELGREIRKAFIPGAPGMTLLSADYSQVELRIMAHFSGDANLIAAFEANEDVHSRTAQLLFGVPAAEVTREMRNRAKTINFGILYGMNEYGLASRLGIGTAEAKEFIANYFAKLPGVKDYIDRTQEEARQAGYVKTILGRRRDLPEIHSSDRMLRQAAENMAVNTPLQGSAADIIKKAMISIHRGLAQVSSQARMLLQVHDELVFEIPESELPAASEFIRREMESAVALRVPLRVDLGHGKNWLEAH